VEPTEVGLGRQLAQVAGHVDHLLIVAFRQTSDAILDFLGSAVALGLVLELAERGWKSGAFQSARDHHRGLVGEGLELGLFVVTSVSFVSRGAFS